MSIPTVPLTLRVGITGHRAINDSLELTDRINEVIDEILKPLSESVRDSVTLIAVSCLAEGADRVIAKQLLKRERSRLQAILPLSKDEYGKDFECEDSRTEFHTLLAIDPNPLILGAGYVQDSRLAVSAERPRSFYYWKAGQFMVQQSDVLVAIWDGKTANGQGGTADVVDYARLQNVPVYVIDPNSNDLSTGSGGRMKYKDDLQALAELNDAQIHDEAKDRERDFVNSVKSELAKQAPNLEKSHMIEVLLAYYLKSSQLSLQNQKRYLRSGAAVYGLAALSIVFATCTLLLPKVKSAMSIFEIGALVGVLLIVWRTRKSRFHGRWIHNRVLTERLRTTALLVAAGLRQEREQDPTRATLDLRLSDWGSRTCNEILKLVNYRESASRPSVDSQRAFIEQAWVKSQLNYHVRKLRMCRTRDVLLDNIGTALFYIALGGALGHLTLAGHHSLHKEGSISEVLLTLLVLGAPALGSAVLGIRKHREYERLASRSESIIGHLRRFELELKTVNTRPQLEAIVQELDALMATESQEWNILVHSLDVAKPA